MMHDNVIMRTIIDLPEEQVAALAELCQAQQISRAEAVRRAVDSLLARQKQSTREQAFGTWKKSTDSRAFIRQLRGEWEK